MAMLNSVARGCVCGVFRPQGPRKPNVMATLLPTSAGKVAWVAWTVRPSLPEPPISSGVGLKKSKTKSASERRFMRSSAEADVRSNATLSALVLAGNAVARDVNSDRRIDVISCDFMVRKERVEDEVLGDFFECETTVVILKRFWDSLNTNSIVSRSCPCLRSCYSRHIGSRHA